MANYTITIERLKQGPLELEFDADPEMLQLTDDQYTFVGRVMGWAKFRLLGQDVLAEGEIHGSVQGICVRCLGAARTDLSAPIGEVWIHDRTDDEDERMDPSAEAPLMRGYTGEEIELDETLQELLMAELPDRIYCADDCKGLCPDCGANLNVGACRCAPEVQAKREESRLPEWKQALKGLKIEK